MNHIKILPDTLINQIAAGEVVERPSSVVKELVENSIDANASKISVEVEMGGKKLIKVVDNGCGIAREDLPLALERHATSKIKTQEDLFKIATLGFRGEALASIGSVAQLKIASKPAGGISGYMIKNNGGKYGDIEPCGMAEGTEATVEQIFFNTPARLKFLKTDATEFEHITRYLTDVALMFHEIHVKLIADGRMVMDYPPTRDLFERVSNVCGAGIAKELVAVEFLGGELRVRGWVGKPGIARSNRQSQYLFVNERPVESGIISRAVQNAYASLLPSGKYPFFILHIEVPYEKVDVNVHPRKKEVKFLSQSEVFQAVQAASKKALEGNTLAPEIDGSTARSYWNTEKIFSSLSGARAEAPISVMFSEEMFAQTTDDFSSDQRIHQPLISGLRVICQIANSYILAHGEEGIVIIDQHAAHERVMYEYFLQRAEKKITEKNTEVQQLLTPAVLELAPHEVALLIEEKATFVALGFQIDPFGGNTFHVHAVPSPLAKSDIAKVLRDVLDDLKEGSAKHVQEPQHRTICSMACRSAIKFGQQLSFEEMSALLLLLRATTQPHTCPHGRPTHVKLTFSELEKRFGRK